jgi:GMP synthase-like glutamine amidotransferase
MKPVAIFRHWRTEGPGYFAIYLERCGLPWRLVRLDAGEPVPADPDAFSGLAFMGGPMSVNDRLPWIEHVCALVRRCADADVPVIGHCLGGQLMAKALGARVTANRHREIGWGEVHVSPVDEAAHWLGAEPPAHTVFHWHGETFGLPPGAVRLLGSALCENQAFALGKHFAMQCHVEMTAELIEAWCHSGAEEIASHPGPGVQSAEEMQRDLDTRLAGLHRLADRIYSRWIEGLSA